MFAILLSALNAVLAFIFRSLIIKFALYFALFFITSEFVSIITQNAGIPGIGALLSYMNGLPAGVLYILNLFNIQYGITTIFSALGVRFLIRRLPIFG